MSLNYANSTVSTKNNIPVINWALFNNRANTDSAIPSEPAVGQCVFAKYYSSLNAGTPSFLLIPARFKSGELYAQIPTNGNGDLNVTRALDTATRVNSSGLICSVASGIPRFDYFASDGTVGCPALLVEPAGTNLARFVNQMTAQDIPAASGGMTTTTGSTDFLAPDGTSGSITKYVGGAASGTTQYAYYTGGGITASASGAHTYSLFVRRGAINPLNFCALGLENFAGGSGTIYSYFNLASGTALTAGAIVQNYGNGWYRLTTPPYTLASGDLTGTLSFFMAEGNGDLSWPVSGALNLTAYTWGSQFEAGSIATSYIPTTTGTVTRNADVISASGNVSGSIGQTEGSIYAEVNIQKLLGTTQRAIIDIGQTNNRLFLGYGNGITNQIRFLLQTSSGGLVDFQSATTTTGTIRIAVGYKNSDSAMYVNGVSVSPLSNGSFTATLTSLTQLSIGSSSSVGETHFLNDKIVEISLFNTRLSNTALQNMTL